MGTNRIVVALLAAVVLAVPARAHAAGPGQGAAAQEPAPPGSRAWGLARESDPPGYVQGFSEAFPGADAPAWLLLGAEFRARLELRRDVRRPALNDDELLLTRGRLYLGVRPESGSLRLGLELLDSRQAGSGFPDRSRDVDELDVLQAWAGLRFDDLLADGFSLEVRAGRLSEDHVDRRHVGRNRFRNTVNAFEGVRLTLDDAARRWRASLVAFRPVVIETSSLNEGDEGRRLLGATGRWQPWDRDLVFEPYGWLLYQDAGTGRPSRSIGSAGLRAFAISGDGRWDLDVDVAGQSGEDAGRPHRAWAVAAEAGHLPGWRWEPRLSAILLAASGDEDPTDDRSGRFDRFFQPGHPYSTTELFTWQNLVAAKGRVDLRDLVPRVLASWGGYWLESARDAWVVPGLRDPAGASGRFLGHELEVELRHRFSRHLDVRGGGSLFFYGGFAEANGRDGVGTSLWLATVLSL